MRGDAPLARPRRHHCLRFEPFRALGAEDASATRVHRSSNCNRPSVRRNGGNITSVFRSFFANMDLSSFFVARSHGRSSSDGSLPGSAQPEGEGCGAGMAVARVQSARSKPAKSLPNRAWSLHSWENSLESCCTSRRPTGANTSGTHPPIMLRIPPARVPDNGYVTPMERPTAGTARLSSVRTQATRSSAGAVDVRSVADRRSRGISSTAEVSDPATCAALRRATTCGRAVVPCRWRSSLPSAGSSSVAPSGRRQAVAPLARPVAPSRIHDPWTSDTACGQVAWTLASGCG